MKIKLPFIFAALLSLHIPEGRANPCNVELDSSRQDFTQNLSEAQIERLDAQVAERILEIQKRKTTEETKGKENESDARILESKHTPWMLSQTMKTEYSIRSLLISPDSQVVYGADSRGGIHAWHLETGNSVFDSIGDGNPTYSPTMLSLSSDGRSLYAAYDETIRVLDAKTGELV